jgi:uncharacterized iron-regulated protein
MLPRVIPRALMIVKKVTTGLLWLAWLSAIGGCSVLAPEWQARHGRDQPLVGRIFDVGEERFVDRHELLTMLSAAEFVLLGERHDHPDHHRLQAEILGGLITAGRRPAVAFEVFTVEDGPAIERHLREYPTNIDGIAEVVKWNESGWPPWKLYRPIVERAVAAGLPVVATNLSRQEVREIARVASEADFDSSRPASEATLATLRETEAGRKILELGLDRPIDPSAEQAIADSIRATHCGHAPEARLPGMILAQRARDAQMAETLASPNSGDGMVLIAGAGHVRVDRAAPYYLRLRLPDARVASLAFLEVLEGVDTPGEHARAIGALVLPFDFVWFTPRFSNEDPCETFRKALEEMGETS